MNNILRMPEDFLELEADDLMSNFDNQIDKSIAKAIKNKKLFSRYAGWNFNGLVWWQNKKWNCEIWVYKSRQETFICNTLEDIMSEVSNKYGHQ